MKMNGADAILRSLEAEGVDVVFGLPGGAILPIYDAFARGTTVRHVLARHEQGAGHMAEGYARASGRVGVAIATSGPGATNLVTPIADAWMDSTPLVCITGQVRSHLIGTDAFQECDITGITIPIVKHSWLVQDVDEIPHVHEGRVPRRAHRPLRPRARRRPARRPGGRARLRVPGRGRPARLEAAAAAAIRARSRRPPQRARRRREARPLRRRRRRSTPTRATSCRALAEVGRLPVVTTLMGKGAFPETHELHFGWPGMHGPKWSNWAMNKCDLLVAVGARFDDRVTGKLAAFAPGATVIHLDIDSAEIAKLRQADIPVVGPLKQVLADLADELRALHGTGRHPGTEPWLRQLAAWREEFPLRYGQDGDMLKPQLVLETLQELTAGRDDVDLDDRRRPAPDVGDAVPRSATGRARSSPPAGSGRWATASRPRSARRRRGPDATVVCVDGDGCFQMTCQELATSVLEGLPIVVVIVNNGYLGMVRQWQDMFFDERLSQIHLTQQLPDYAQLAEAYGGVGFTVDDEDELEGVARGGARLRAHRRRRRPGRPARAVLPDDPGRRRRARPGRVPGRGRRPEKVARGVRHTLSVLVENKPGALMRISSMFARRGFNIESLAVGPTERHDVSRITLRVDCEQHPLEQIEKQMHKLVNVLRVSELEPGEAVERELALMKVTAPPARRGELIALSQASTRASPTSAPTRSSSRSSATPRRSTRSRSSSARTGSRSSSAPAGSGSAARPRAPNRTAVSTSSPDTDTKETPRWQRSTAKATSTSCPARSPSSATAARGTRMPSTCATPASRSRSACATAARRGPRQRRPA